mmetsp:Transcript_18697/g.33828  ORF Transcript_18697/g.33828 Transcript_18697/m.33828 type:complete len:131 (+) Transcript_18697:1020-1412(+)
MDEEVRGKVTSHYSSYFTKYGISPKNVAKASMYFVGLGTLYTAGLFATCFTLRPTRHLVRVLNWPKLHELYSKVQAKTDKNRGRAAEALGETLVLKGILGPVALPLKVWLAVKLVKAGQSSDSIEEEAAS